MIVGEANCPSMKMNEMHRLQPILADLLSIVILALLPLLRIGQWIGYALPLRYVSSLSHKPAISRTFAALARTGLITGATPPPMFHHQTYYSHLLLKRGTL